MATDLALAMQITANTTQLASATRNVQTQFDAMAKAGRQAASELSVLRTIEISRVLVDSLSTVARSLGGIVVSAASTTAELDDLGNRTGIATDALQAYRFAADQSGVSVETFGRSIQKLNVNLGEAQTGNRTVIQSFADLGLSVEELSRLSPEAAFERVAASISQLPNPAQQAAAAVGLFGKAGADLVPVFAEGAGFLEQMRVQATELGLVLGRTQVQNLAALDDSLNVVSQTFRAFTARVTAELAPALTEAASEAAEFIASLDVQEVARSAIGAISGLTEVARSAAASFGAIFEATAPLAATILPVISGTLDFIARNLQAAALGALAASGGLLGYSLSAVSATAATTALSAAITTLLSRTGIGVVVVGLGALFGALALEYDRWATASGDTEKKVVQSINNAEQQIRSAEEATKAATRAVKDFGDEAQFAFKLPAEVTERTLVQDSVNEATSAFRKLAQEAGEIANVPAEVADSFEVLAFLITGIQRGVITAADQQGLIADSAAEVLAQVNRVVVARKAEEDATRAAADAAAKASEEARQRTAELARSALDPAEASQLQLSRDLLSIQRTIADAERDLIAARAAGDSQALTAAQERLRLTQQTAAAATEAAKLQARERELAAIGLDEGLLRPVETVADEFKKVREAFDRGLINGGEARTALKNLAAEGISIRASIADALSRPAQQALNVNDIRTSEGAGQFLALATGREDPAIEQMRQQLRKLEEIRQALIAVGAAPVEILGA